MRAQLAALALIAGFTAASPTRAQLALDISTVDPLTKLPADKWVQLATRIVNPAPIVGKDAVYVVNATGEDLSSVTCRGYFLVGMSPYITGNKTTNAPATLPKWTVSLVPTEGFNTYCKGGVEATGIVANYHGAPNAGDKTRAQHRSQARALHRWFERGLWRNSAPSAGSAGPAATAAPSGAPATDLFAARNAAGMDQVRRGQWPSGCTHFVLADSDGGAAWEAYCAELDVKPRWMSLSSGLGAYMPAPFPPASEAA